MGGKGFGKRAAAGVLAVLWLLSAAAAGRGNAGAETAEIAATVARVGTSIRYGTGTPEAEFNDEIVRRGEGHCGHYAAMLLREFLKLGYRGEIVSVTTYNHRMHSLVQIRRKSDGKKILADATTGLVYAHSVEEIVGTPSLCREKTGRSRVPGYSGIDFWESVKSVTYLPFVGWRTIGRFRSVGTAEKGVFYPAPNGIAAVFDGDYDTYAATKARAAERVTVTAEFPTRSRLSSIVIVPYDNGTYPSRLSVVCEENNATVFRGGIRPDRGLLVVNIVDPRKQHCTRVRLTFSGFRGQKRLLVREIRFYGKKAVR